MTKINKIKKTNRVVLIVMIFFLITPLASAYFSTVQEFLADVESNYYSNYYVWHDRTDPEIKARINTFASQFSIPVSNTKMPNRNNFIIITAEDSDFGSNYVTQVPISYVTTGEADGEDYLSIYLTVEEGYSGGATTYEGALYEHLDAILDDLSIYQSWTEDKYIIKVADGEVIEERPLTCEEFGDNDRSVWYKDTAPYHQGGRSQDLCYGNVLAELTCIGGNVHYEPWTCPRGCSDGRCIYTIFFLSYQYDQLDVSYSNFDSALNAWIDV